MDAMVGHRSPRYERFGWASARLDDVANFVPARVTAALVARASAPGRRRGVAAQCGEHAPAHPSPNAGVAEAAFAAVRWASQLGGPLRYGDRHRGPAPARAGAAARRPPTSPVPCGLVGDVEWLLVARLGAVALRRR